MCLAALTLLCTVLLCSNKWTSATLTLSPCGTDQTLEVIENGNNNVFTCSGANTADQILWRVIGQGGSTDNTLSNCGPLPSGQTRNTCNNLRPTIFSATRTGPGTSEMTFSDSDTNSAFFFGSTIICRSGTQDRRCQMDHIAIPQSPSCSLDYKTDVTPWRVRASCSVTQVYSYLNRTTCQLYQTSPGSATPSPVVDMTTSGSGKYKSGTCDVSVTMPTVTGTYSYKVVITPGRLDVTAGTIQIRQELMTNCSSSGYTDGVLGDVRCQLDRSYYTSSCGLTPGQVQFVFYSSAGVQSTYCVMDFSAFPSAGTPDATECPSCSCSSDATGSEYTLTFTPDSTVHYNGRFECEVDCFAGTPTEDHSSCNPIPLPSHRTTHHPGLSTIPSAEDGDVAIGNASTHQTVRPSAGGEEDSSLHAQN